jgi:hypothetical protein
MTAILTSLFVVALASLPASEDQDIREHVKKNGSMSILINKEHPPADLGLLIARADLVVRGVVLRGESSLLDNKVVTHYAMRVLSVIRGKTELEGTVVTVRREGGRLSVDGGTVFAHDPEFPFFEPTEEYVLFLRHSADGAYSVPLGAQGAFRVDRGKVSQLLADGPWNREKAGLSLPDFLNEIAAAAKK